MNFQHGLSLIEFQTSLYDKYKKEKPIFVEEINQLKKNIWIFLAIFFAPSHLIIKQFCLIDFITNNSKHQGHIIKLIDLLGEGLWLEGYSYWIDIKIFLDEYAKKFKIGYIDKFIEEQDNRFLRISYKCRDGKLYPPLFGDLEFIPLQEHLQNGEYLDYTAIWPVSKITRDVLVIYDIKASPIKFNVHIPKKFSTYYIVDGIVKSKFKWYEGYDKKYKTKWLRWFDIFDFRRILSFFL